MLWKFSNGFQWSDYLQSTASTLSPSKAASVNFTCSFHSQQPNSCLEPQLIWVMHTSVTKISTFCHNLAENKKFTPCLTRPWFTTMLHEVNPAVELAQKFPVCSYLALCLIFCSTYIQSFSPRCPELFSLYLPCYYGSYLQAAAWHCSNCT